ncbi:MAG: lysophospholipase [Proteobacteria bacterium]|nr:lysophospholipase [Pseudomonadota bacterium]
MFNASQRNVLHSKKTAQNPAVKPVLDVLTTDEMLLDFIGKTFTFFNVQSWKHNRQGPLLIDPAIGSGQIKANISEDHLPAHIAIIRRPTCSDALFLALRMTKGQVVEDPRINPEPLKLFIDESLGMITSNQDRRVFPRGGGSGVDIIFPPHSEILNISAYGACIRTTNEFIDAPVLRLRLRLKRPDIEVDVDTKVAFAEAVDGHVELRLCFYKISPEAQHELMRISNAELLCQTISETFTRCEDGELSGFRRLARFSDILELLYNAVSDRSIFAFASMHKGRPVKAIPVSIDEAKRNYKVALEHPDALGNIASYHQFSASIRHESYLMDGYVLKNNDKEAVLTFPKSLISTDHRSLDREKISSATPFFVTLSGKKHVVKDFSLKGFSFYVSEGSADIPLNGQTDVIFELGEGLYRQESVLIRNQQMEAGVLHAGAIFLDTSHLIGDRPESPLIEETLLEENPNINRVENTYYSTPVYFPSKEKKIAGLWSEVIHDDQVTVVIIPPAWAKTKESTSLLSQYILSSFDTNKKSAAVLRFDYSNAIGESENSPQFSRPGYDSLGIKVSDSVKDLIAAVDYVERKFSSLPRHIVIVGMSFSGPLCLRAAVSDKRVTRLIQFMGASDIQDLVRTSTGGIDYVSRYRAGIRSSIQNVLGMLSDTDRWCKDGLTNNLLLIQDAQADIAKLNVPLLWIHGIYDAFVNEQRIRSILDVAKGEKYFFKVPYGHIPTKSNDAIQSFLPAVRFLLNTIGVSDPVISAPTDQAIMQVARKEWERAPRVKLPSLKNFWREYMIGTTEGSLGFDILSMTQGYKDLMTCQVRLMDIRKEDIVYDLGGGMGHVIAYLGDASSPKPSAVHLFDFVPQLFNIAERRAKTHGISLKTTEWYAESNESIAHLKSADVILMSLFLSCLQNPLAFLSRLGKTIPRGSRIVASTIRPDADISMEYMNLLKDIKTGTATIPQGYTQERFLQAVRDYMNSAAWLLRLTDEGTFHLFEKNEFIELFECSGLTVQCVENTFGTPHRAVVIKAVKE